VAVLFKIAQDRLPCVLVPSTASVSGVALATAAGSNVARMCVTSPASLGQLCKLDPSQCRQEWRRGAGVSHMYALRMLSDAGNPQLILEAIRNLAAARTPVRCTARVWHALVRVAHTEGVMDDVWQAAILAVDDANRRPQRYRTRLKLSSTCTLPGSPLVCGGRRSNIYAFDVVASMACCSQVPDRVLACLQRQFHVATAEMARLTLLAAFTISGERARRKGFCEAGLVADVVGRGLQSRGISIVHRVHSRIVPEYMHDIYTSSALYTLSNAGAAGFRAHGDG